VALEDDLGEIVTSLSIPKPYDHSPQQDVLVSILHGGRIVSRERLSDAHLRFVIELPRPLQTGDTHSYSVSFTLPDGQPMVPHYVFMPLAPCDKFELIARFDQLRLPRQVWLLDGAPLRVVDS